MSRSRTERRRQAGSVVRLVTQGGRVLQLDSALEFFSQETLVRACARARDRPAVAMRFFFRNHP